MNYVLKNISFYGKEGVLYTPKNIDHTVVISTSAGLATTRSTLGDCATFHRVVVCATGGDSVGWSSWACQNSRVSLGVFSTGIQARTKPFLD